MWGRRRRSPRPSPGATSTPLPAWWTTTAPSKAFGEQSPFGRCIAHGFLSGALFSTLAGNYLPGAGSLYVRQSLNFLRPVYAGDTITATFEVVKKGEEVTKPDGTVKFSPGRIVMKATAVNQRGEVVVEGEACSMAAREKVDCSRF